MLELTQRIEPTGQAQVHDTLTLPLELRTRGRLRAVTDTGLDVGLFLDRGPVLRNGDCLQADTGEIIRVRAAPEPVVTAHIATGLPLARLCYHLGNRHVQLAIGGGDHHIGWVRFPPDHVLEALAERLGATLERHQAPFDPEPGAYDKAGRGNHSHAHHPAGRSHSHSHEPDKQPGGEHAH